ncbi:hypothetical protein BDQ12DRAFT_722513 [Crucibulum laeve]|uniref:NACHT domain-containing protein n=1 Tax=Crucibulum laeve TaxID=68775 RepID=A0A5C3M2Z0_9AGAR|nr:hypothetical protein BDQ12DRAFT_722513 [Crucibulum laeve]
MPTSQLEQLSPPRSPHSSIGPFANASNFSINHSNFYEVGGNLTVNNVRHIEEDVEHGLKSLLLTKSDKEQQECFNRLHHVIEAPYNSLARESASGCLDGTRTEVLQTIQKWIVSSDGTSLFWLNGMAGTGKSSIAHSIAALYDKKHTLGASFFFSRDQQATRETMFLFQSIAFQLGNKYPMMKIAIIDALKRDQTLLSSNLRTQLRELVLSPLFNCDVSPQIPIIIVLDALDECEDDDSVTKIIDIFVTEIGERSFPLKIFATSRPERHLRHKFETLAAQGFSTRFILHEIEPEHVKFDIKYFIRHAVEYIAGRNHKRGLWATEDEMDTLVDISAGMFIVASTAVAFIRPVRGSPDPRARLQILLDSWKNKSPENNDHPLAYIDRIYTQILSRSLEGMNEKAVTRVRMIVGTIILLYARLTSTGLSGLLQLDEDQLLYSLEELQSVILVPIESYRPIQAFHLSFHDYLTSRVRCADPRFFINAPVVHSQIAHFCFERMMKSLKKGMQSKNPFRILNNTTLAEELKYSCQYWALHIAECLLGQDLLSSLQIFAFTKILYWVEALSIIGDLKGGVSSIKKARMKLQLLKGVSSDLLQILHDAEKFMIDFYLPISQSPIHVYNSALVFTPRQTLLYRTFSSDLPDTPKLTHGFQTDWDPFLRKIDVFFNHSTAAISQDGTRVALGVDDGTVRIWNVHDGSEYCRLEGRSEHNWPRVIALSHDESRLASGSYGHDIQIWSIRLGDLLFSLHGHQNWVQCISFSSKDSLLATGSLDKTIRIWDLDSDSQLYNLDGHTGAVNSVVFSYDNRYIISGSDDMSIRIWGVSCGIQLHKLDGHLHAIWSVAISHDSTLIASGSGDSTVRIWKLGSSNNKYAELMNGHTQAVRSIALSSEDDILVTGSEDTTICIWDIRSGEKIDVLHGNLDAISSVAISRDGTCIVSSSKDGTLRIWDITSLKGRKRSDVNLEMYMKPSSLTPKALWKPVITKVLSKVIGNEKIPSKTKSLPKIGLDVEVKNNTFGSLLTSVVKPKLSTELYGAIAIAVSSNGSRVAISYNNRILTIWNADQAVQMHRIICKGSMQRLHFSQDVSRLISYSDEAKVIVVWDTEGGSILFQDPCPSYQYYSEVSLSPREDRIIAEYPTSVNVLSEIVQQAGSHTLPLPMYAMPNCPADANTQIQVSKHVLRASGWVLDGQREVCWVPSKFRGVHAFGGGLLATSSRSGNVVLLRLSNTS